MNIHFDGLATFYLIMLAISLVFAFIVTFGETAKKGRKK